MSGYSYSEIQNMQQKAMERVREMKRNSDAVTQSAQKDLNFETRKNTFNDYSKPVSVKVTNMPPNFPEDNPYPSFKEYFREEKEKKQQNKSFQMKVEKQKSNTIESLFDEPDKALLLGLIMLLKSEGADEALIIALSYILS